MTDEQLVARYLDSGDGDLLSELVDRHLDHVRRVVYPMVLSHADADDVVQEVFIRVVRGLPSFRQESQFSTWLRRITMNTAYRFLKKRARSRGAGTEVAYTAEAARDTQPDQAAMHGELDEAISNSLAQLAPELRGAVVLTIFDDVPPAEVAAIEGCSRATIYWRVHRARKLLKKHLAEWLQ